MRSFELPVSYSQIAVFDARLDQPFNDWRQEHVDQGFAWRPGSVSFSTLVHSGRIAVSIVVEEVESTDFRSPSRVIVVPFVVPGHGEVEVATMTGSGRLSMQPGAYSLTYKHGVSDEGDMWAAFVFCRTFTPVDARIELADQRLMVPERLVMSAEPA